MFGRRRPIEDDWRRMSPGERLQLCEAKLRQVAELEQQVQGHTDDPDYDRAMRNFAEARRNWTVVLNSLHGARIPREYLSLWGQLNQWVNDWAEADRRREQNRNANRCTSCGGSGSWIEGSYHFRVAKCSACGGSGRATRNW